MSSADETARMIREGAREADRLCRHFGRLAARLQHRGYGRQIAAACWPLAALAALPVELSMTAAREPSSSAPLSPVGDPQPKNRPSDGQ